MPNTEKKTSALAVASLVLSFACFPIGGVLGLFAFLKINKPDSDVKGKGLAIAAMCISALIAVPGVGCSAAILIPNFVKYECRTKQSQAKGNLKGLFVAEESFRAEAEHYGSLKEIEYKPYGEKQFYRYSIKANGKHFEATATGIDKRVSGDVWKINQDNALSNDINACR